MTEARTVRWRPGPGLLVTAAFLGPGTLTVATLAGAEQGYELLWVIPLAAVLAFVLQEAAARVPLATGQPLARALADQGPGRGALAQGLALASVGAIVLGAAAFQAGNLAGASLGLEALMGGPTWAWVLACADVAFLVLWFGGYRAVQRVLTGLVAVMASAFLLQLALTGVDVGSVLGGLVPDMGGLELGLVLALLGTTVVPYNLFLHSSALEADRAQRDEDPDELGRMRVDLGWSVALGGLVTATVLLAAAGTLQGTAIENAGDMAESLGPLLGPLAEAAFAVGLLAAGFTSAVTAPLAAAWAVGQLRGRPQSGPSPWVWAPILLVGASVAMLPFEPVGLIVVAQVANALVLPLLVVGLLVVSNRASLGLARNRWPGNLALAIALTITTVLVLQLVR